MMFYVNDASLQKQFATSAEFINAFTSLLRLRALPGLQNRIRSQRALVMARVTPEATLREVIIGAADREFRQSALIWLDKTGPYIDDDRAEDDDDYFEFERLDVTDSGLGEAARRTKFGEDCATYSFVGGPINFAVTPLEVDHGLIEDRLGTYSINNFWAFDKTVEQINNLISVPNSWKELLELCEENFRFVRIHGTILDELQKQPYQEVIGSGVIKLVRILNDYMVAGCSFGFECEKCKEIIAVFFSGDRALFSAESKTNQETFKAELTFRDPEDHDHVVFAHWHGKISYRFFRMHFEWPVPNGQKFVKVAYIGPKITRS